MTKKIPVPEAPIVTKLPLPNSDNALVIDLPDGQKLVVGKMATGTVIEVATWRGTGRPDSRTTRLMLGVSSQEKVDEASVQVATPKNGSKVPSFDVARGAIMELAKKILTKVSKFTSSGVKLSFKKSKEVSTSPALASAPTSTGVVSKDTDTEVQAWLDSIIAKSEKKELAQGTIKSSVSPKGETPKVALIKKVSTKKAPTKKASTPRRIK
jgi:hypothetical protein